MKKILIIGGGISGLATGIFALKSGYEPLILEKANKLGGCCGGYYRKGYYIDHCIHWLVGSNYGTHQNRYWRVLRALDKDSKIIKLDSIVSVEYNGVNYELLRDYKKSWKTWLEQSPEDKKVINFFFTSVEKLLCLNTIDNQNVKAEKFNIFKRIPLILKTSNIDIVDFSKKFKNPGLRLAIQYAQNGFSNLFCLLFEYTFFIQDNADVPSGGSQKFADNIKTYYESIGGQYKLNANVEEINIENKKVKNVKTSNGDVYEADYIVSCVPPEYLLHSLLNDKYEDKSFKKLSHKKGVRTSSAVIGCYAIDEKVMDKVASSFVFPTDEIGCTNIKDNAMCIRNYSYEKELYTKNGKTLVTVYIDQDQADYYKWKKLSIEEYKNKKIEINNNIVRILKNYFKLKDEQIIELDFITPMSFEKRLNSSYGAFMCYHMTKHNKFFFHKTFKIKGIDNLYLSSQWVASPGGLPMASSNGKRVMKKIIKEN